MTEFLAVPLPPSLNQYKFLLEKFVECMLFKLDKNSHKDTPNLNTIPEIIDNMQLEIDEFEEQFFENKDDPNTLVELADIANFAFLAYAAIRMHERAHSFDPANGA